MEVKEVIAVVLGGESGLRGASVRRLFSAASILLFPLQLCHPEKSAMLVEYVFITPLLNGEVIRLGGEFDCI